MPVLRMTELDLRGSHVDTGVGGITGVVTVSHRARDTVGVRSRGAR